MQFRIHSTIGECYKCGKRAFWQITCLEQPKDAGLNGYWQEVCCGTHLNKGLQEAFHFVHPNLPPQPVEPGTWEALY